MFRKTFCKTLYFLICITLMLLIVSCGAGGGGGDKGTIQTNSITYPQVEILPNQPLNQTVGDYNFKAPAEAFPQRTELTITVSQTGEKPTANFETMSDYSNVKVITSNQPQAPITITPVDRNTRDGNYLYFFVQKTANRWEAISDFGTQTINSADLVIDKSKFYLTSGGSEVRGLIGKIKVLGLNTATNLVLLYTDSSAPTDTALLFINGINANAESMRYAANLIRESHRYREIYAFDYDWRREGQSVAQDLGGDLDYLHSQNRHVDIVAHSRGVLIARQALEQLGKTDAVANLYSVCGPNAGSPWASATEILRACIGDYLNRSSDDPPFGLAFTGIGAINELIPGSDFFDQLNTPQNSQRGFVSYHLIAGNHDLLVSRTSALALNITMDSLTAKTVETFTFNYGHSDMMHTSGGVADLSNVMSRQKSNNIEITTSPQENVNASDDGWYFDIIIKNKGPNQCILQDHSYDFWGKDGNWTGLNWYSPAIPPGVHFPWQYQLWNKSVAPRETVTLSIHIWPDTGEHMIWEVGENNKANYMLLSVKYHETDMEKQSLCWLILHYNDIWPTYPNVRSRSAISGSQAPGITISEVKK